MKIQSEDCLLSYMCVFSCMSNVGSSLQVQSSFILMKLGLNALELVHISCNNSEVELNTSRALVPNLPDAVML